jgi:hypothetical protein
MANVANSKLASAPAFAFLGTSIPQGDGSVLVKPGKPVQEVGSREAAQLLGIARSYLCPLLDQPLASKLIKWRWLNPDKKGKRLFNVASLHAYRKATQEIE